MNRAHELVWVDMDGVLCDFYGEYMKLYTKENQYPQRDARFFENLPEMPGAIAAIHKMREKYDVRILTAPSVRNPMCYTEKRIWIEEHIDYDMCKNLVICPDKSVVKGDFLIDDTTSKGQLQFEGTLIQFGKSQYPNWDAVLKRLM